MPKVLDSTNVIKTTNTNQIQILFDILRLNKFEKFELDATYGKGNFYKDGRIPTPDHRFDIIPRAEGVLEGDCRNLPLADNSITAAMFDPPFIHAGMNEKSLMGKQFGSYKNQKELFEMYEAAADEFKRVIAPKGLLCWKNQDITESGIQVWNHCKIWKMMEEKGWYTKDLYILVATDGSRIIDPRFAQKHARKWHSYFWVFLKK